MRSLDDVLVDAVIDDVNGAAFWREHFARGELRVAVPWPEFARTLLAAVDNDETTLALLSNGCAPLSWHRSSSLTTAEQTQRRGAGGDSGGRVGVL